MAVIINNEAYLAEYPTDKDLSSEYVLTSINKAENLLDSLTGGKLLICGNETETTNPNYRNDTQKGGMKKAIIEQTRFNINLSNDETEGQTTFTRGNISYSENRPKDRQKVSRTAERYLEMAEIYFLTKLGAIRLNGSNEYNRVRDFTKIYVSYEIGDKRYVMVNPTNPVKEGQILAIQYHGDVPYAEGVGPNGISSWADQIIDSDGAYYSLWEAPTIVNGLAELESKKLDKPTNEKDSPYSQAVVPSVNSTTKMTITNKLNDLLTHEKTDVSFAIELENLTVEQTAENNLKIRAWIPSIGNMKGKKATASDLPTTGQQNGDVWYVVDDDSFYIGISDESKWEDITTTIDLDNYYTKGEVDGFVGDLTKLKTTNKDNLVNVINTDLIPRGFLKRSTFSVPYEFYGLYIYPVNTSLNNCYASVEGKMEKVITLDFDTFDDTCVLKYYVYFNEVSEVAHRSWDMVVDKTYYERFPEIKKGVNGRAFEVLLIGASHGIGGNASENDIMPYYVLLTQTFGSCYKGAFVPNSYANNYARFGIEFSCEIRLRIF